MEKLQPLIKHHFWVLFGLALLIPPIAWWLTTGSLAAQIEERTSTLDSTFSGISTGQGAANDDWTQGVNQLISIREEQNRLALDRLWKAQTDLMVWPPNVRQWMTRAPYRGEIEDPRIKQILPDLYRDDYEREVRRVWLIPEPIDDGVHRVDRGRPQKVVFPYEQMPRTPSQKWTVLPPTWSEIWNAQEDLWLLTEVLQAVKEANSSTSSITDSYVKQIMQVQLFGGSRKEASELASGSGSGTGGGGYGEGSYPGAGGGFPGGGFPGAGSGRKTGRGPLKKPAEFPVTEEYEVANAGGASRSGMPDYEAGGGYGGAGGTSGSDASSDPQADENRYIQNEDAYRTRGFKLRVAIHQMQVPNLIRGLLNSQYPIEIVRFQQSALNPEQPGKPSDSRRRGNPYAASGGFNEPYGEEMEAAGEYSEELSSPSEEFGFEEGGGALSSDSYSIPDKENVQVALNDRDLVDLVVIGEIYIYNPPTFEEGDDQAGASDAASPEGAPPEQTDEMVEAPRGVAAGQDGAGSTGSGSDGSGQEGNGGQPAAAGSEAASVSEPAADGTPSRDSNAGDAAGENATPGTPSADSAGSTKEGSATPGSGTPRAGTPGSGTPSADSAEQSPSPAGGGAAPSGGDSGTGNEGAQQTEPSAPANDSAASGNG